MKRWPFFLYGLFSYLLFNITAAYMAGFFGSFLVPKSIDSHADGSPFAWIINLSLILMFGLQHSIMARPWFKQIWTRVVPQPIERSTYCLLSSLAFLLLMWQWRGQDAILWDVHDPLARGLLWGLFAAGWLMVPAVTWMLNHFDLFGVRQVWLYLQGKPCGALPFKTPMLYGRIRHPLYIGWTIAVWATPTMTVGHALLAAGLTGYMLVAVVFEERDLVNHFGEAYRTYQRRVPMFVPRLSEGSRDAQAPATAPTVAKNVAE